MASISRTIRRGIIFKNMNKKQRQMWREMKNQQKKNDRKGNG